MPGTNTSQHSPEAEFKPFSWHADFGHSFDERLAEDAQDIGNGIHLALQLIEHSALAVDNGDVPFLNACHRGHLMRLVIASARLLANSAERRIELRNNQKQAAQKRGGAK